VLELISAIRSDAITALDHKLWILGIWLEFVKQNPIEIAHLYIIFCIFGLLYCVNTAINTASNNQCNHQKISNSSLFNFCLSISSVFLISAFIFLQFPINHREEEKI